MTKPKLKFIAVCTPTLGNVSIEWASVLRGIAWPLNVGYVNFFVRDVQGGEIAETRNRCVQLALSYETEAIEVSHLFWLDDDVICTRMALLSLLRHDQDIASGVYFTKGELSEPLIFPGRGCGTASFVPDQVQEAWGHGMGLTLVKSSVYKRMATEMDLGRDKYGRPQWYKTTGALDATLEDAGGASVDHPTDGKVLWVGGTEDLYFLDKAHQIGINSIVDTCRAAFGWHYDSARAQGYPLKQWKQYQSREPITWDTPDGVKTWERN